MSKLVGKVIFFHSKESKMDKGQKDTVIISEKKKGKGEKRWQKRGARYLCDEDYTLRQPKSLLSGATQKLKKVGARGIIHVALYIFMTKISIGGMCTAYLRGEQAVRFGGK